MNFCPVCGGSFLAAEVPASRITEEFDHQREFILARMATTPSPEELKDLIDFMHDAPAGLQRCAHCDLVRRAEAKTEDAGSYQEDPNDPDVMAQVYPRYVRAFRNKEHGYRPLLRHGAEVIEIGPHLGSFLQTAEEWNWKPVGVDVGADTTDFMRRNGLTVRFGDFEDVKIKDGRADAIFIWNCFEQLLQPMETLGAARRALRRHGLLIVRVPNLHFYRKFRSAKGGVARKALAYNNLLGFPYLYGYTIETLNRLLARAGFVYERGFNSELLTTPFADVPTLVAREQSNISRLVANWSELTSSRTLTGPWIEAVYRRSEHEVVVPRNGKIDYRFMPRAVA